MSDWADLIEELDRWADAAHVATLWWRDDDASDVTPALDRLLLHAGATPLALAVIPALATRGLADRLTGSLDVSVLQHGWRHETHLAGGTSEYPPCRDRQDVLAELRQGKDRLDDLFGSQSIGVFAPPWHGFDGSFLPLLPRSGLRGLSAKGPRQSASPLANLHQVNAHLSAIRWSDPPAFGADEEFYLAQLVGHLRDRRIGHCDATEPTGLLTHHLIQDDASYAFIGRLLEVTAQHSAAEWIDIRSILPPPLRGNLPGHF